MSTSRPAPLRWGFLGAGFVASRALAPAVHAASGAVLQVVGARDQPRAFALGPARVATSYAAVCEADDVDAIYIALPNDAHLHWVLTALAAGKHVLCEKPLGVRAEHVHAMASAAATADRLLAEAAWQQWHPRTRRLRELLSDDVGPWQITGRFTFSGVPSGNYRWRREHGGGALLDVGGYVLGTALPGLGEPVRVVAATRRRARTGVDAATTARLAGPLGSLDLTVSLADSESQEFAARSDHRRLDVSSPAYTCWREPASLRIVDTDGSRVEQFPPVDAYQLMVEAFATRARGNDAWTYPLAESLAVARARDDIAAAARTGGDAVEP